MRFPALSFAAVAGLWQQPFVPEETITSTRHVHVTRTVTNPAHTIYAIRFGTSTMMMDHIPTNLVTKAAPSKTQSNGHLELRSAQDTTSTMHVKVTMTVEQIQSTVFASRVGTSVSTMTAVPQSLIDEAAADAAAESSARLAAVASAEAAGLVHSTVTALAAGSITSISTSQTTSSAIMNPTDAAPAPAFVNSTSVSLSVQTPAPSASSSTTIPIGLELRSNADVTSTSHVQATSTQEPATTDQEQPPVTVIAVVYGSSTSIMTSVPPSILASIASSSAAETSQSITSAAEPTATSTQSSIIQTSSPQNPTPETNAAQVKSTQTALFEPSTYSDETSTSTQSPSTTSSKKQGCFGVCTPISSTTSTSKPPSGSTTLTSDGMTIVLATSSPSSSSEKIYTIPVSMSTSSQHSTSSEAPETTTSSSPTTEGKSTPFATAYGSSSSASSAAEIAAENAEGAAGSDNGSFKLSKGGFAAIISVVSIGVGLGIIFLILFVIAKRRQWHVRASIARASRRLTGHFTSKPPASEKKPTLPIIEPRMPLVGPRPAPARQYQGIDAQLHSYRGVQSVGARNPEAWRQQMRSQQQRVKPCLRVDTQLARDLERGGPVKKVPQKGDWRNFFRAL